MNYDLTLKGYVGGWDFDADYVDYILDKYKDRHVSVLIDSTGGRAFTGMSVCSAFRNHGDVSVHLRAANASAATIAALGAKEVTMDAMGVYLVHCCSATVFEWANMNAEEIEQKCKELEKLKNELQKLDLIVASAYAKRCKKPVEDLQKLMSKETWLTAQEALEWGFIDKITDYEEDPAPVLDIVTATAFADAGIPMPPISMKEAKGKSGFSSVIAKFFEFFRSDTSDPNNNSNSNLTMDPKQKTTEKPEAKTEQVEQPEAKTTQEPDATAADDIAAKDARIAELEAKIAELEKSPAAEHKKVVTAPKAEKDSIADFCASMKSAQELYDALP